MVRRRVRVQTRHHLQKGVLLCGRLKFETVSSWGLNWQLKFAGIGLRSNCPVQMSWRLVSSKALERLMNWWVLWLWIKICGDVGLLLRAKMAPQKKRARRIASPGCGCYGWNRWDRIKHLRFLKECFCCMPVLEHVMPMLEYIVL